MISSKNPNIEAFVPHLPLFPRGISIQNAIQNVNFDVVTEDCLQLCQLAQNKEAY